MDNVSSKEPFEEKPATPKASATRIAGRVITPPARAVGNALARSGRQLTRLVLQADHIGMSLISSQSEESVRNRRTSKKVGTSLVALCLVVVITAFSARILHDVVNTEAAVELWPAGDRTYAVWVSQSFDVSPYRPFFDCMHFDNCSNSSLVKISLSNN